MPEMPGLHWGNLANTPITGAPVAGVNEIQSLVIGGGPPTTLTFRLRKDGVPTAPITWANVNATLLAAMNAALNAAFGTNNVVASAGASPALTAGIGQVLLTYGGRLAALDVSQITAEKVTETGTATTLTTSTSTPGVTATFRDAAPSTLIHSTDGNVYRNSSTVANAPTWVVI